MTVEIKLMVDLEQLEFIISGLRWLVDQELYPHGETAEDYEKVNNYISQLEAVKAAAESQL